MKWSLFVLRVFLIGGIAVAVWLIARWGLEAVRHTDRLNGLEWRIHVNGVRGKSAVTHNIAGMLREAGYGTIGKSTGTVAAVITNEGHDEPIVRKGPATILEQIEIVKEWVTDEDIARFDYSAFKDNVAIGLVLARMLDIPRDVAMKGMVEAAPDPGVLLMRTADHRQARHMGEPLCRQRPGVEDGGVREAPRLRHARHDDRRHPQQPSRS